MPSQDDLTVLIVIDLDGNYIEKEFDNIMAHSGLNRCADKSMAYAYSPGLGQEYDDVLEYCKKAIVSSAERAGATRYKYSLVLTPYHLHQDENPI